MWLCHVVFAFVTGWCMWRSFEVISLHLNSLVCFWSVLKTVVKRAKFWECYLV